MQTNELIDEALDWAVAKCEGRGYVMDETEYAPDGRTYQRGTAQATGPHYSTDWSQGGPIIEREGITTICWNKNPDQWHARRWLELDGPASTVFTASTPLIAAMRCYVASKLGDDVEIPEELV